MSSHVSSWTNPTWLASMKQGSHIMLQRLVRSTVSTEPRPCLIVEAAVVVQLLVVVRANVATREHVFEVLEERRVDRHGVFEVPVHRAILHHHDLAVLLDDRRLDLTDLFVEERLERPGAVENRLARLAHAHRAQRVGLARPTERRLGLLYDFCSGLSDHRGMKEAFWLILLTRENTCQAPSAATANPFSMYLMGACISLPLSIQ